MVSHSSLLAEVSNPFRTQIILLLGEEPHSLTNLAKKLDLSKPEVSRHLARLSEAGVVHKPNKPYELTPFGQLLLQLLSPLEFTLQRADYFRGRVVDLPPFLTRDLDSLGEAELVEGTGIVMFRAKEMVERIDKKYCMFVDQPFPFDPSHIIDEGYFLIPPSLAQEHGRDPPRTAMAYKHFEVRSLDPLPCVLALRDDEEAMLFFPDMTGKLDYSHGFHIKDSVGVEFAKKVWNYYWERGEPVKLPKE